MRLHSKVLTAFFRQFILLLPFIPHTIFAASGTWIVDASGNWSLNTNWSGAVVASGSSFTADFGTVNITADRTVTLDVPQTITTLVFGDATTATSNWILAGPSALTLTGSTPTVSVTNQTATINAVITGSAGLAKSGAGILILGGTNTYTGTTTINAGILRPSSSTVLVSTSPVSMANVAGAILDITGFASSVGSLTGGGGTGGNITLGAANLTVGGDNSSPAAYAGVISGTGGVTKVGTGTQAFTGASTFTGVVNINSGVLAVGLVAAGGTASALGASAVAATNLVINGGTLRYTGNNASTNRAFTVGASGCLIDVSTAGQTLTLSGGGTGSGGLTKLGAGGLTLSGSSSYTGATTISAGSLNAGVATSAFGNNSAVTLANIAGATLNLATFSNTIGSLLGGGATGGNVTITTPAVLTTGGLNTSTTFSGVISGTGGIAKEGSGIMTLSGTNIYTGSTGVNNGTLKAGVATSAFGSNSTVTLANTAGVILDITGFANVIGSLVGGGATGGNVTLGAATLTTGASNTNSSYAGVISGTGGVIKSGTGIFTLTGSNTFTGPLTINAGTVSVGTVANAAAASPVGQQAVGSAGLVFTGGSLQYTGNTATTNRGFTLSTGGGTFDVTTSGQILTISGIGTGTGGLTKIGAGMLTLSGVNTFAGDVAVNAGSLNAGVATSAFGNATRITTANVASASVDLSNFNSTIGSLAGGGVSGGSVNLGSATLTVGGNNLSTAFAGQITGTGGILKLGTGTLTLSRANTYSGATALTVGTLRAGIATNAFGTNSAVTLTNSAGVILDLAGLAQTIGSLASTGVTSPASVVLGSAVLTTGGLNTATTTYSGIISGTGGITKVGTGAMILSGTNTYTGATTVSGGVLQAGAASTVFGSNSAVTLANTAGVALALSNFATSVGSLAGGGAIGGNLSLGSAVLTLGANNTSTNFGGIISGTGGITKNGSGTYTQSGLLNSYTGATTVGGGILSVPLLANGGSPSSIGSALSTSSNLVLNSGTLQYSGASTTTNRGFTLGAGGGMFDIPTAASVLTASGVGTGSGSLTKSGNASSVLLLSGANNYTGATSVTGGILRAGSTSAFGVASPITLSNTAGVVLDLSSNSNTIGSLAGGGATGGNISLGSGILTIGADNNNTSYDGVISGSGGIVKTGTGIQTLSRAGSFTGATVLNGGFVSITTIANGSVASPIGQSSNSTSNLVFNGGGLQYTGVTASTDRSFTLSAGGGSINVVTAGQTLTFGGVASGSGGLTKLGDGVLLLSGINTYSGPTTVDAGTLMAGAAASAFGNNSALTLANTAGAGVNLNNANVTIGSLAGGGSSGGTVSLGSGTLTCGGNNSSTVYNGVIDGTGGLTKSGTGTFTVSGSNTYTGATSISGGTHSIATLANGGTPSQLGQSTNASANLVVGGGTLQYTGATASSDRGLTLASGGGTIDVSSSNAVMTLSGVVAGSTGITKSGPGTLALLGANTFAGGVTLSNGTIAVSSDAGFGSTANDLTLASGTTLKAAGTLASTRTISIAPGGSVILGSNNGALTVDSRITGNGSLTLEATGINPVALTNNGNDFTGTVSIGLRGAAFSSIANVNGGTSSLGAPATAGNGTIVLSDGASPWSLTYTGNGSSSDRNWTVSTTGSSSVFRNSGTGTLNLSGTITTSGVNPFTFDAASADIVLGGVISGPKQLVFSGNGHSITLSGANTYTGSTNIQSGTLIAAVAASALGNGSAVVLDNTAGAALNLNNFSNAIGSLSGGGAAGGNVVLGNGYLTTGSDNTTTTFSGVLSGSGGLIKTGSGDFTLDGANTYTGTTTVSGGRLFVTGSLANSTTTVASGASLSGTGSIGGPVNVSGTLEPGSGVGNLTLGGTLVLQSGSVTTMEIDKSGSNLTNDTIRGITSLTFGGTLTVTASGSPLASGDNCRLFVFGAHSNIFSSVNLPVLPGALNWNTDSLYTNGTIYVAQPQTINFGALTDRVLGVADFAPGATTTSGLSISYSSSDTLLAKIIGGMIHIVSAGTVTITATQQGNTLYSAAAPVSRSFTIFSNTAPGSFVLLDASGATDGGEAATVNPVFSWSASTDPESDPVTYTLDIATVPTFSSTVVHITGISGTSYTLTSPISDNTRYFWRVTSSDPFSNSTVANASLMFYTSAVNHVPSSPIPLSPAVNTVLIATDSLSWTRNDSDIGDTLTYTVQLSTTTDFSIVAASRTVRFLTGSRLQDLTGFATLQDDRIYYWRVNATDPHGFASAFTSAGNYIVANIGNDIPTVPVITAPSNGAPVSASTVLRFHSTDGDSIGTNRDTLRYQIIVSQTADFGSPVGITDISTDTILASNLIGYASMVDNQRYYWKVTAYDNKSAYSSYTDGNNWFYVKKVNGSLIPSSLTAPVEGSFTTSYSPQLDWTPASSPDSGVTVDSYTLELADNIVFTSALIRQVNLLTTSYSVPASVVRNGHQKYYWRVWAHSSKGDSTGSAVFSFYAPNTPPGAVTISTPINNTSTSRCPLLDWSDALDADSVDIGYLTYTVEIGNDATFASVALRRHVTASEYQVLPSDQLSGTRKFWWRVWSCDGTADSVSSAILSFTARNALPNAVTLQVPGPASPVPLSPQFDWSIGTDPDSADRVFTYTLEVSSTSNFSSLLFSKSGLSQSGYQVDEASALGDQTNYWWRVWVKDPMGDSTVTASRALFATSSHQAPGLSTPLTPADYTVLSRSGSLIWTRRCSDPYEVITYTVRVSADPLFTAVILTKTDINTTTIQLASLDDTELLQDHHHYYWQVDAIDSYGAHSGFTSGQNVFALNNFNEPPVRPSGLYPHSQTASGPNGILRWHSVDPDSIGLTPDTLTYTVVLSTSASFSSIASTTTGIKADSITINQLTGYSSLANNRYYWWKVQTADNHGATSVFSDSTANFWHHTQNAAPSIASGLLPISGSTLYPTDSLHWSPSIDSDLFDTVNYVIQIAATDSFTTVLSTDTLRGTSVRLNTLPGYSKLQTGTGYEWRVKGIDLSGASSGWVGNKNTFVSTPPSLPAVFQPLDDSVIYPTESLRWSSVNDTDAGPVDTLRYILQMSVKPTFAVVLASDTIKGTKRQIAEFSGYALLADNAHYYWHVSVVDIHGAVSAKGPVHSFFLEKSNASPSVPNLLFPTDSGVIRKTELLNWTASVDPNTGNTVTYRVLAATDSNFTDTVVYVNDIAGTSVSVDTINAYNAIVLDNKHIPSVDTAGLRDNHFYYWSVAGVDNHNAASSPAIPRRIFVNTVIDTPSVPSALAPTFRRITFPTEYLTWHGDTVKIYRDTVQYTLQLAADSLFVNVVADDTVSGVARISIGSMNRMAAVKAEQVYWWRVKAVRSETAARGWSLPASVFYSLKHDAPTAVSGLVPQDSSSTVYPVDLLSWNASTTTSPDQLFYEVYVNTSPFDSTIDTSKVLAYSSGLTGTSVALNRLAHRYSLMQNSNVYYWKVRSLDEHGYYSPWSMQRSFRFISTPPAAVSELSPDDDKRITFSDSLVWTKEADVDAGLQDTLRYVVLLATQPDFAVVTSRDTVKGVTTLHLRNLKGLDSLKNNTSYYWAVQAVDPHGASEDRSMVAQFIFNKTNTAPNAPEMVIPDAYRTLFRRPFQSCIWSGSDPENDSMIYRIEFSRDSSFVRLLTVVSDWGLSKIRIDEVPHFSSLFSNDSVCFMRVRAADIRGAVGLWSRPVSFRYNSTDHPATIPVVQNPEYNGYALGTTPFVWTNSTDIDDSLIHYEITICSDTADTSIALLDHIPQAKAATTSVLLSSIPGSENLIRYKFYYWKVGPKSLVDTSWVGGLSGGWNRFVFGDVRIIADENAQVTVIVPGDTSGLVARSSDSSVAISFPSSAFNTPTAVRIMQLPAAGTVNNEPLSASQRDTAAQRLTTSVDNANKFAQGDRSLWPVGEPCYSIQTFTLDDSAKPQALLDTVLLFIALHDSDGDGFVDGDRRIPDTALHIFRLNEATSRWELASQTVDVKGVRSTHLARVGVSSVTERKGVSIKTKHFSVYSLLSYQKFSEPFGQFKVYPSPFLSGNGRSPLNISYRLGLDAIIDISIFSMSGGNVWKKHVDAGDPLYGTASTSEIRVNWDGRNSAGRFVDNGMYLVKVRAKSVNGQEYNVQQYLGVVR